VKNDDRELGKENDTLRDVSDEVQEVQEVQQSMSQVWRDASAPQDIN